MRTTLDLNDELFRRAKKRAADEGIPLRELVEAALRSHLSGRQAGVRPFKLQLKPFRGKGLQPGASEQDLNDRARLHDLMDGRL